MNYIRKKQLRLSVFCYSKIFFHKYFSKRVRAFAERAVPRSSSSTHHNVEHQLIQVSEPDRKRTENKQNEKRDRYQNQPTRICMNTCS